MGLDKAAKDDDEDPPLGPGGLDPGEVFESLPESMQKAFESQDIAALHAAVSKLSKAEAKYHMTRCEDSGLWVPDKSSGPPPYRRDGDDGGRTIHQHCVHWKGYPSSVIDANQRLQKQNGLKRPTNRGPSQKE